MKEFQCCQKKKKTTKQKTYLLSIFLFFREDKCQAVFFDILTATPLLQLRVVQIHNCLSPDAFRKSIVNHRVFCQAQIFLCYDEYQSDLLTTEIFCIFINYWQENILSEKYFITCLLTDFFQLSSSTTLEMLILPYLWTI